MDKRYHEMYKKLGLNLAYYRKSKGYTHRNCWQKKLDVDRTTISKIELAVSGVSLDLLFAISELLEFRYSAFRIS